MRKIEKEIQFADGREKERRAEEARSYNGEKAWYSIIRTFNTLW
jgi:hypothetical protein